MRKVLRRVIQVLDGTPRAYGRQERGQSVLELALVTPLLIILLVGLVEIGWFARNYLTLQEVTRVGARRGAVLGSENSPLSWDERASYFYEDSRDPYFSTYPPVTEGNPTLPEEGEKPWIRDFRRNVRSCAAIQDESIQPNQVGFYNLVACQMINSLDPLQLRWDGNPDSEPNNIDDIIISVFAIQVINNQETDGDLDLTPTGYPTIRSGEFSEQGYTPVVVGRYPTRTNECNVWEDPNNGDLIPLNTERDPFDYYRQNADPLNNSGAPDGWVDLGEVNYDPDGGGPQAPLTFHYPLELAEEDQDAPGGFDTQGFDPYVVENNPGASPAGSLETQRGWTLTGQHRIEETRTFDFGGVDRDLRRLCWGSERTLYWVQERLRANDFVLSQSEIDEIRNNVDPDFCKVEDPDNPGTYTYCDQREFLTNQGLVLAEIYWRHDLLLGALPVFSPVYNALDDEQTTIYVWSAFPAPSVAPNLRYNLEASDFVDMD